LTTNGQLNDTRGYHYKTNQFHMQHDFLFLSKRPVRGKNIFVVSAVKL